MNRERSKERRKLFTADAESCPDFAEMLRQSSSDHSLFEQIAECFSDRLSTFASYYCRDNNLGQDAFQEAMLVALTKLHTFRGESPIEPWLRRIVVTSCSRLRRGRKNSPAFNVPLDEGKASPVEQEEMPGQELELMLLQRLELVQRAIDALKEPNRSLLRLHDMHETPISELAEKFDMTEEAVKSRLKRSRSQVREKLIDKH